jgi:uncharacterized membrane protein
MKKNFSVSTQTKSVTIHNSLFYNVVLKKLNLKLNLLASMFNAPAITKERHRNKHE